ncbi:MAG: guanylate cyclase [Desulfobacterales bacterium]|nr:guanylate cyclase [Desulfobacterales bacterium]
MDRYYKERFQTLRHLIRDVAPLSDVTRIIETVRDELRRIVPNAMEVCILLLDEDAAQYTHSLQCSLYDTPVSCQSCKRDRPAVRKAVARKKPVVVRMSDPIIRPDKSFVDVGPECAMPIFVEKDVLAIISVVIRPQTRFSRKDFFLIRDYADVLGTFISNAKRQWEMTQEKIRISKTLNHLTPFVPGSVRRMANENPELLTREKERRDVTILFLDLAGYTRLNRVVPEQEVNAVIETLFSSFVDPIHRFNGEINETAGDGLMIIFKDHSPEKNAENAVKAAFEVLERSFALGRSFSGFPVPIEVNMGINSGQALVGMTRLKGALETRMTFTASGNVTNIAARLSDKAQGGDILIGPGTRQLIGGLWPVYPLGEMNLKGIREPVVVHSLIQSRKK